MLCHGDNVELWGKHWALGTMLGHGGDIGTWGSRWVMGTTLGHGDNVVVMDNNVGSWITLSHRRQCGAMGTMLRHGEQQWVGMTMLGHG